MLRSSWWIARSANVFPLPFRKYVHWAPMSVQERPAFRKGGGLGKRESQGGRAPKRQRTGKEKPVEQGSNEEVLLADVRALFAAQKLAERAAVESPENQELNEQQESLPAQFEEIDVKV